MRDALILGSDKADVVARLRGEDIYYHIEDTLCVLNTWGFDFCSEIGLRLLRDIASEEMREFVPCDNCSAIKQYRDTPMLSVVIMRRNRIPAEGEREYWQKCYAFAESYGITDLKLLVAAFKTEIGA
jgi:hypothetical protein